VRRSCELEILERGGLPRPQVARAYRDLTRIHRFLGDTASVAAAVRSDPLPVRRILDIGCGEGGVLRDLRKRLGIDVVGVDLNPELATQTPFPIIQADAVLDPLPSADIAFCMYLGHHLADWQLVKLIRNAGRSCRRFLILDLVRHPLPLALFRLFVAPFVSTVTAADGPISIRRSYTPLEMAGIAQEAVSGSSAQFRHSIAPLYVRQTLDVSYRSA
jgi:SAM-dependent methyltransferase